MDKEEAWKEATKLWNKLSLDSISIGTYGNSYIIRVYYIPFKKNPNRHFRILETKEEVKDFIKEVARELLIRTESEEEMIKFCSKG